ncbi:Collectin-12 [Armadillidium nasatum]|uniref:Collectin-12 n=1 Tax=Armadillidium nasatum TaxID=96803 RepID=A0A5N5T921_9CRUS|nr:Collectin-12 [Armadillidium nasatum]
MAAKYFSIPFSVILLTIFVSNAECACPKGFTDIEGGCYKYDETVAVNYEGAKSLCEEDNGSHLAYIKDCNTFAYLVSYLKARSHSTTTSGFWIGATDEDEESYWVWGNGYPVRMGVPFWGTSDNWDYEPNGGKGENCAQLSISDQYFIHDEDCQSEGVPLCQADSVETPKEVNNYKNDLAANESYWIGAYETDHWIWTDFTDVDLTSPFWGSTNGIPEPNGNDAEHCAVLYRNDRYYFHDADCSKGK